MIVALAVWIFVFAGAAGYGRMLIPGNSSSKGAGLEITRVYSGLLVLATILLAAALFINLSPAVGLMASLPGLMMYWRDHDWNKRLRSSLVILALIAMFISVREINFYDTALYHQQAVKWLAEHGLVRGVALVNFRLGFVSSWFALAAPFDHGLTAGRVGIVGGMPFAFAVASSLQIIRGVSNRRVATTAWAILGMMLSVVAVVWHVDTSLSPDMMVWLLPMVIVTILTDPNATEPERLGRATIVAAMACLIKLTSAPALAYCFALLAWRFFRVAQDRRRLAASAAVAFGVLILLVGASLVASGCPLFPSPLGCTSLDWSVGADAARSIQTEIDQFAQTPRHGQIFPLAAAAALASVLLGVLVRPTWARHVLGISWVGILFTFAVAPVPRYGLGYFLLPIAGVIAAALERALVAQVWPIHGYGDWAKAGAVLVAVAGIISAILAGGIGDMRWLLYPPQLAGANGDPIHIVNRAIDVRSALAIRAERRGELTVWVPASSDQCWDAPLPCTPRLTRGDLRLRHEGNLDTGFLTP